MPTSLSTSYHFNATWFTPKILSPSLFETCCENVSGECFLSLVCTRLVPVLLVYLRRRRNCSSIVWHRTVPLNRLIQGLWMSPGCAQQRVWFLHSCSHQAAHAPFYKILVLATVLSVSFSLLAGRGAGHAWCCASWGRFGSHRIT